MYEPGVLICSPHTDTASLFFCSHMFTVSYKANSTCIAAKNEFYVFSRGWYTVVLWCLFFNPNLSLHNFDPEQIQALFLTGPHFLNGHINRNKRNIKENCHNEHVGLINRNVIGGTLLIDKLMWLTNIWSKIRSTD